jgi:hypothetical protein
MGSAGSHVRQLLSLWEENQNVDTEIQMLVDGQNFVMFFKKGKDVYGAPEESRVTFANMKNPKEMGKEWAKDANFLGMNLNKALKGAKTHNLFSSNDLDKIKVINKEEAERILAKEAKKLGKDLKASKVPPEEDKPANTPTAKSDVPLGEK